MRIEDAKKAYSAHLNTLQEQKSNLTKLLKENENNAGTAPDYDRLELTRELSEVDAEYEATKKYMDHILATESFLRRSTEAKQQGEAAAEGAQELGRLLTIYRRIASGGIVPPRDEYKLMEFSPQLYMTAKSIALLATGDSKEYDSLWKNVKESTIPEETADEIVANAQISVPSPRNLSAIVKVK